MTITYLKKANKTPSTDDDKTRQSVQQILKDLEKRRLSLSYKNTQLNPRIKFTKEHKIGDVHEGQIKNIVDYAIFVSIKNSELDGMIHY